MTPTEEHGMSPTAHPHFLFPVSDPPYCGPGALELAGMLERLEGLVGRLESLDGRRRPGVVAVYQLDDIEIEARRAGVSLSDEEVQG